MPIDPAADLVQEYPSEIKTLLLVKLTNAVIHTDRTKLDEQVERDRMIEEVRQIKIDGEIPFKSLEKTSFHRHCNQLIDEWVKKAKST